jgi:hypothetical protein
MRPIRLALGSTAIDPALLTHAERLQHDGYLRREEAYGIIRTLARAGTPIKEIVRRTGRSRKAGARYRARRRRRRVPLPFEYPSAASRLARLRTVGRVFATAPSCGGGFTQQSAFAAVCASSLNRPRGGIVPKVPDVRGCGSRRLLGS